MVDISEMNLFLKAIRERNYNIVRNAWECSDADELFTILYRDYPEEAKIVEAMFDMDLV